MWFERAGKIGGMQNIEAVVEQSVQLLRQGRLDEAEQGLSRVLSVAPTHPDALHGLSVIRFQREDRPGAISLLRELVSAWPDRLSARYDLACMLLEGGNDEEAEALLEFVTRAAPGHVSAWYQLGFVRKALGRHAEADKALRTCLQLNPGHAAAANDLARLFRDTGDYAAALAIFERAAASGVATASLFQTWAQFLSISALPTHGLTVTQRAAAKYPLDAELRMALAQALEGSGDRKASEREYRAAMAIDANRGFAIGSLLSLLGAEAEPSLVARAEHILADGAARAPARAIIGYGLGKVFHAQRQYEKAFQSWRVANEARQIEAGRLQRDALLAQVAAAQSTFTKSALGRCAPVASDDPRPLFIVGMPRSGTTLVEQILSAHPQIEGLGELPDIPIVAENFCRAAGNAGEWPKDLDRVGLNEIDNGARHYLAALAFRADGGWARLVDKAPLNFFNVGMIALMFSKARFIWCRRDPRDVCLSIYSENFAANQKYATDLADLAFYYQQHEVLMRHWQTILPGRIKEVDYSELVSGLEMESRALMDFVGLDWHPDCLQFHAATRAVQTPSRWQVRQPIYRSSLGRWRKYAPWLGPLTDIWGTDDAGETS